MCDPYGDAFAGDVKTHPKDDDHSDPITDLACLDTLKIIATASEDGLVKIWDQTDNSLIRYPPFSPLSSPSFPLLLLTYPLPSREIQFAEPLHSLTFANPRGDLLIGMSDQVSIIRVQDYIPNNYITKLVENESIWRDDVVESPGVFDSSLDFWAVYRDGDVGTGWHVEK